MPTALQTQLLGQAVGAHARTDFTTLRQDLTVGEAMDVIRKAAGSAIQYYYVVDATGKLVGVLPLRKLLTVPLDQTLRAVMHPRVIALPATATVLDACEFFVLHKLLAFPVVNDRREVVGVIDVSQFTTEMIDLGGDAPGDDVFEAIGFRVSQVKGAGPLQAFRFRFPWLLATIGSGVACAALTSLFEATLLKSIVLGFFLALVLGLAESVGIQSMTVTIQTLKAVRPSPRWYARAVRRELATAGLIALACGVVVGLIVQVWRREPAAAAVVGGGVALALVGACFFGLTVPTALHALKLDPKIAAGPITLALTDLVTLLAYFGLASVVLG